MNAHFTPYTPSSGLIAKLKRKVVDFQARRMLDIKLDRTLISFTFDDFPRSCLKNGLALLERENWQATFYVSAGLCGVENHHGENFNAQDIARLKQFGHEIACHTFSHMDCDTTNLEDVLHDIEKNQKALAKLGADKLEHFAYPYGALNAKLKSKLSKRFKTMRGIKTGPQVEKADLNALRSYGVYSDSSLEKLLADIKAAAYQPAWITVFAHDIRTNPSKWGCKPVDFARVIGAVKDIDANVLPIGKALEYLEARL